jgi:hypothetical protein
MQTLVATWLSSQVPGLDCPYSVCWEDGSEATEKDYDSHRRDTRISVPTNSGGCTWHFFPDVVAEAYYCPVGGVWGLRGDCVDPVSLCITNPFASDDEINNAISALPIEYRVKIIR